MSKPERASHSLKTTVRAVLAAQRFAESGGHGVMGGAGGGGGLGPSWVGTSNYHRDEVSEVPFAALIHFMTFSTEPELSKPWQMKKPSVSTGTGFYIGDKKILTNSHVIRHSTSLRVERHGQPGNFPARVLCEGVMCDLAIVTVDHDDFFVGLPAVKFQPEVPELDDTVICLGYPLGATSITVTRGVVSNVHMKDLSLRGWNDENLLLAVQIDAAINPGNSGGPVFSYKTNEVVGVAFAGRTDAAGMGFIIPVPVIDLFLSTYQRTKKPQFTPLPMLGISTQDLVNPSLRRLSFGGSMPPARDGILITEVVKGGCAEKGGVKPGDVLVRIDGVAISEKGDVPFRGHERLDWVYLVTKKPVGDKIKLDLLRRGGQPMSPGAKKGVTAGGVGKLEHVQVETTLEQSPSLLPALLHVDYRPGWVIIGGLVFLRAGQPLLDQIISRGASGGFAHVQSLMSLFDKESSTAGIEEAVILQDVLAHDINVTYEEYRGLLIHSINGTRIQSLKHLASFYEANKEPFITIEFGGGGRKEKHAESVVMEMGLCAATQMEILVQHKIPHWCSDDVLPGGSSAAAMAGGGGGPKVFMDPMALLFQLAGGQPGGGQQQGGGVQQTSAVVSAPAPDDERTRASPKPSPRPAPPQSSAAASSAAAATDRSHSPPPQPRPAPSPPKVPHPISTSAEPTPRKETRPQSAGKKGPRTPRTQSRGGGAMASLKSYLGGKKPSGESDDK